MNKAILALFSLFLLVSACSPMAPAVKGAESRKLVEAWDKQATEGLEEGVSAERITIPVVVFRNPGKGFSKARFSIGPQGKFSTFRSQGSSGEKMSLQVTGAPGKGPDLIDAPSVFTPPAPGETGEEPREWKTVYVPELKREIRYHLVDHAFGDTNEQWATEVITLTSPQGVTASYRATVEVIDSGMAPVLFARLGLE